MDRPEEVATRIPSGLKLNLPFRWLTAAAAMLVVAALLAMLAILAVDSAPAFRRFGFAFLVTSAWNPVTDTYGALAPVTGTLVTSVIAMLVGTPVAVGVAIFLNEICPHRLRDPLAIAIELLAAVPSIIYGMWGLFVLAPLLGRHVYPALIHWIGPVPVVGALFQGPPFGIGTLTAGLILAIMVIPFIASVARQVLGSVPPMLREAAYGVGATTWEVARHVLIPHARRGLIGGVMLGLGRALGETMAVTFVIGNAHRLSASLLHPGTTISAVLANEFTEASGDLYLSSLVALGLILFAVTFAVLLGARALLARADRRSV
ncbi:MAG: phosphate ABC transporter permease subunit PstC [Magnetospirillum sp.]|nr:phosphate ABC transporter permease subunit PstC [Magnetospirillum sp.]